jgi:hypothetical protein
MKRVGLRGRILAALLLTAAPVALGAQTFGFGNIRVEGNQRIQTSTILAEAGIAQGETLSAGQVNDAIQSLRATGLFESVEAAAQGDSLVIRVAEYSTISRIAFEGNTAVSDEQLRAVVGSVERRVFSPTQAEQDTAAIAQAYVNAGRVNAVVVPAIIRREGGTVDLVFQINEGGVTEIERITFVGNEAFGERRLRNVLETRQAGLLRALIRADTFVAERIEFDRQALTDFYRSRGYADFTVENVNVNLTSERDAYLITFNIREGQRFRFGDVTVTSAIPEVDPGLFRGIVRVQQGDVYSPVAIENDIARIETLAQREGSTSSAWIRASPATRGGFSSTSNTPWCPASASSWNASTSRATPPPSTGSSARSSAPSKAIPSTRARSANPPSASARWASSRTPTSRPARARPPIRSSLTSTSRSSPPAPSPSAPTIRARTDLPLSPASPRRTSWVAGRSSTSSFPWGVTARRSASSSPSPSSWAATSSSAWT